MEEKCQHDDNVSSSDKISQGLASSIGENKTSIQHQSDADVSTISSERVQSAQQTSLRSDLSSENGQPLKERKNSVAERTGEVSQGDFTIKASNHNERLKMESLSSKESGDVARLSSVDSVDLKQSQALNQHYSSRYLQPTLSDESKNVQESESSRVIAKSKQHQHIFDLNEDIDAEGAECSQQALHELNSAVVAVRASEPISVVAKVGVPVGLPNKPLQFGGELGWRGSGNTSAFRSTSLRNSEKKEDCGNLGGHGCRESLVSRGFDLNVALTMDSELPADQSSVIGSKQPERIFLDLNSSSENVEKHLKTEPPGFDLNERHVIEDTRKNICQQGSGSKSISDYRRPPYWADMNSVRGFSHVQGQPFLVANPTAEQLQMVVPIQSEVSLLPHASSGVFIGKINGFSPTFYAPSFLPHLNNQHGAAVIPQITGPVLAAYPGTLNVLESSQGLNPNAFANMRPTFIQNGNIAGNIQLLVPARNTLLEERMRPVEQVAFPSSSAKRREPDGGWDSSQMNHRRMAPWG